GWIPAEIARQSTGRAARSAELTRIPSADRFRRQRSGRDSRAHAFGRAHAICEGWPRDLRGPAPRPQVRGPASLVRPAGCGFGGAPMTGAQARRTSGRRLRSPEAVRARVGGAVTTSGVAAAASRLGYRRLAPVREDPGSISGG